MRLAWKILGRIAIGLAALIVSAIVGVMVATQTNWFRNLARDKVNAVLAGTLKGKLVIGRIQGSIWGDLILDDVTLIYNGDKIAYIQRLRIAYGILSVLHDTIDLTHLDISGLQLNAKQDAQGKWNAMEAVASAHPAAPTQSGGKTRYRVLVRDINLEHSTINVTRANGAGYAFEDAGLSASVYVLKEGLRANLSHLWGHASGTNLPAADLYASLNYQNVIQPAGVTISAIKINTQSSRIQASGKVSDINAMAMDIRLDANRIAGADIAGLTKQWSPNANVTGSIHVTGSRPDLRIAIAMDAADAKIRGDVRADLSKHDPRYSGLVNVSNLNPTQLLTMRTVSGVLNASVRGHGAGTSVAGFDGIANLQFARLEVANWNVGDLIMTGAVANQVATYDLKIAQGRQANATSRGKIDFRGTPNYQIALLAKHLDLQKFQNRRVIHTDLNLAAQVKGSGIKLDEANAIARVDWYRSVLGPARIDSGAVRASIARGTLQITQASISAGKTKASVKGRVALIGKRRGDLAYNLKSDDLSPWMTLAGRSGGGALQVVGTARGPFDALTAGGSASMVSLQTNGVTIGAGKITYAFAGIGNDAAHGRLDAGFDSVHTNVDLKSLYVGVDLLRLRPTDLRIVLDTWDAQKRNQKLAAEIRLKPNVIDVSLTQLALQMSDGTWQLLHPATFHKDARQIVVQNLRLTNQQRQILLQGAVAFGGAQDVQLLIKGFELTDLNPFIASNPGLGGTLDTSVHVAGTSAAPTIQGQLQIKSLQAHGYALPEVDANANYRTGQMVANASIFQDAMHQLIANVTLPMQLGWDRKFVAYAADGLNGRVHSNGISLAFLNAIGPRSVKGIDGNISMDVALTGPINKPIANGGLWLWGGKGKIVPLGLNLDSTNMTVLVSPQAVFLKDLNVRSKDGNIDSWGSVALNGYLPSAMDVHLKMDNWPAIDTSQYVAYTAADIRFSGTPEAAKLDGEVEVLWGVIKPELSFLTSDTVKSDGTVQVVYDGEAPPPAPPSSPGFGANLFQNMAINLEADIHRNTWIKVAGSSAELEGKVRVLKKSGGPVRLVGSVNTVRGQIAIAGKPLDLQKGEVTFTGSNEIDPSLDIIAQRQLPQYTVAANIGGTAKKPTLTLSSAPQMSQADILSVLMFGQPASQLNNGQQASLQNQAAVIAGSYAASAIGQEVADALGLQALQFAVENGMASVGTYLTQDIFVSAAQNIAPSADQTPGQASQKATITYYLTKHISIDTSESRTSLGNASEVDLTWHTQY